MPFQNRGLELVATLNMIKIEISSKSHSNKSIIIM